MSPARAPFEATWAPGAVEDLESLFATDTSVGEAALAAVEDVRHHRKVGKALGDRHVTGDLTGFFRVKFDVPGSKPERYRLVYALPEDKRLEIWALGERAEHIVYNVMLGRATPKNSRQDTAG